jgi:electron transfer flavoprotein-quinone oxidoreductase
MDPCGWDVVVVGAGPAGLTAALALARAGFAVAVVEAAATPGGRPGGGAFSALHLAHPDVLGAEGVAALAWERRLVERGRFATDGLGMLGGTYRDAAAFSHGYTVLRPIFLPSLADAAVRAGARLLVGTTVEGLVRDGGRVVGVCTPAGVLYADLVFLAEGDAAGLVAREDLETSSDLRDAPRYLLCLEGVFELPAGAVEERFGLGAEEGAAYDLVLRNGRLGGHELPLNVRGWVSTNRQGLTLGLLVSVENLRRHLPGRPTALLEWATDLPALRPWLEGGRRVAVSARLVRGGGARDVPRLAAYGLALGGAAAGVGTSFPHLDDGGAATATGLLLAQAAARIRAAGVTFSRQELERHYVAELRQTHHWQDLEFLRRWPGFVRKADNLFGRDLDLILGSAHTWTRPRRWLPVRAVAWVRLLSRAGGWALWPAIRDDLRPLAWALRARRWAGTPALGRLLLDGSLNALRDLAGRRRPDLPPAGRVEVRYHCALGAGPPPRFLTRWLGRFRPVLGAAVARVLEEGRTPLVQRLAEAVRSLLRQLNLLDLVAAMSQGGLVALLVGAWSVPGVLRRWLRLPALGRARTSGYKAAVAAATDLGPALAAAVTAGAPLAGAAAPTSGPPLYLLWPRTLPDDPALAREGLDRICPAGVFEFQTGPAADTAVAVHAERCVECEACWRTSRRVDGSRGGQACSGDANPRSPASPQGGDPWGAVIDTARSAAGRDPARWHRARVLLGRLEDKLGAFDAALQRAPRTIDRALADHLELLARYAQQWADEIAQVVRQVPGQPAPAPLVELARELAVKAEARARRTWDGHFTWAAADGSQLRRHHIPGLLRMLDAFGGGSDGESAAAVICGPTLGAMEARELLHRLGGEPLAAVDAAAVELLLHAPDPGPATPLAPADSALRDDLRAAPVAELRAGLARRLAAVGPECAPEFDGASSTHPARMYRRYALRLADGWQKARMILGVCDTAAPAARQALRREWEQLEAAQARLGQLAQAWERVRDPEGELPADAEVAEELARQEARVFASRLLLLDVETRTQTRPDAEVELALLRAVLEDLAWDLEPCTALVERRLEKPDVYPQRPLVEPGSGPPPASVEDYLGGPEGYRAGDFLLAPVDLLRSRLVPEMLAGPQPPGVPGALADLTAAADQIRRIHAGLQAARPPGQESHDQAATLWRLQRLEEMVFVTEAITAEVLGRAAHLRTADEPESLGARLVVELLAARATDLAGAITGEDGASAAALAASPGLRTRLAVKLRTAMTEQCPPEGVPLVPRHIGPEALALEAVKADLRRLLGEAAAVLSLVGTGKPGPEVLAAAVARAAAWLQAGDSVLGRLAWLARTHLVLGPDDPAPLPPAGRRAFAACLAEARQGLGRLDEDLRAMRQGYWPARARAAELLVALAGPSDSREAPGV